MITVNASRREPICLRHQGENDAMRVAFPLSAFEADWPGGTPLLLVQRPRSSRDAEAYPVALSVDGHTAYWTVSASDVEYSGYGKAQLQWRVEDVLVKSCIYDTVCVPSLHAGAEPPDEPPKRWFDAIQAQIGDLSKLTTKAKDNLVAAINEAARSGGGSGGAGTIDMRVADGYIQYSNDGGATWENLIAIADLKGADGKDGTNGTDGTDGHTPVITASKSGKVTTIKVDGEAVATVNDGADGTNGTDGAPGKDGADGAPGKDGTPGKDGVTPDIKIGTVTTLPAGSAATASMGGTAAQPTLNLGIPKGANGDNANVTKDAVVGALGFTPIGADDVPVKSVNGATGATKSAFYVTITSAEDESISADKTLEEIYTAYEKGYAVYVKTADSPQIIVPLTIAVHSGNDYAVVFNGAVTFGSTTEYTISNDGSGWTIYAKDIAFKDNIPTALKNPYALNIKIGNATTSYDGSAAKTVEIPEGGTGKDGITPTIGANGNWYLGDEDTGKPSRGETGPQGATGPQGETGPQGPQGPAGVTPDIKIGTVTTLPAGSAATASMGGTAAQPTLNLGIPKGANGDNANVTKDAVVGALGFTPISADDVPVKSVNGATGEVKSTFYVTVTPTGSGYAATADKTAAEVYAAYAAGYAVYAVVKFENVNAPLELPLVAAAPFVGTFVLGFGALGSLDPTANPQYPTVTYTGTAWMAWLGTLARSEDIPTIPTKLPNPYSLNIKIGNATTSYDGSAAKTVEIPKGVPPVTTADNGKFLRVVNGAWAAVEIANANGGSF